MKVIYSDIKKILNCFSNYFTSCSSILLKFTKFPAFENPKKGAARTEKVFVLIVNSELSTKQQTNKQTNKQKDFNKVNNYKVNFHWFALCLMLRKSAMLD